MSRTAAISRIVAIVWLTIYAAAVLIAHDPSTTEALSPTALLAAGYLFGSVLRSNGQNGNGR